MRVSYKYDILELVLALPIAHPPHTRQPPKFHFAILVLHAIATWAFEYWP